MAKSKFHRNVLRAKKLGEEMGYASLMAVSCALWRQLTRDCGGIDTAVFFPVGLSALKKGDRERVLEEANRVDQMVQKLLNETETEV